MGKTTNSSAKNKAAVKSRPILKKMIMLLGWVMCAAMFAIGMMFIRILTGTGMFPKQIITIVTVILVLLTAIFALLQKWPVPGGITKVLAILLSVIMVIGGGYIATTGDALNKMSGVTTQIDHMGVYVLTDSEIGTINDLTGSTYGIIAEHDRENTDNVIEMIKSETGADVATAEYAETADLITGLYNQEVSAIILNSSFLPIVENVEGYQDVEDRIRQIWAKDIETKVDSDNPDNQPGDNSGDDGYLKGNDNVFTLYISGIDVDGSPTVNRNSDVNILMTVNTRTRQILMINTPRDYYVPLSISNGVKDKLTHAGCYGIQVSVDTLKMLYGVEIDDYVKVNFTGFVNIIDQLGGVDVYSDFDFVSTHGGDHFTVGYNHVNGQQALGFARERYAFPTGDRQRGKNQMAVIQAMIKKMTTTDALKNYNNILDAVSDSIATSMSYDEITDLIRMQLKDMKGWDIVTYSVDGTNDTQPCYSLSSPNYVMPPIQETVDQAKAYLAQIYSDQIVTIAQ